MPWTSYPLSSSNSVLDDNEHQYRMHFFDPTRSRHATIQHWPPSHERVLRVHSEDTSYSQVGAILAGDTWVAMDMVNACLDGLRDRKCAPEMSATLRFLYSSGVGRSSLSRGAKGAGTSIFADIVASRGDGGWDQLEDGARCELKYGDQNGAQHAA